MDVWQWFTERTRSLREAGDGRLAAMLDGLPSRVVNLQLAQVDAAVPEALAAVRALGDPWLEVFVRHWHMQSRVFDRREGERALGDAVALVEFSHRDEARECPQSVCTVQDLAACYGIVDGPGWAPERLAVSAETLARIDPSWACWDCISSEHADALRDDGRPDEALRFLDAQRAALAAHKNRAFAVGEFGGQVYPTALLDAGRPEEALAALDALLARRQSSRFRTLYRRTMRALVLARLGRLDDALAALPPAHEAMESGANFEAWSETAEALVAAGLLPNDDALGRTLGAMCASLDASGSVRSAVRVAARHGALSLARGERWTPRRALALMERCVPRLRQSLDALDLVARLRTGVAAVDATAPSLESPDAVFEYVRDATLDDALAAAESAHARWAHDERICVLYGALLSRAGLHTDAADTVERWCDAHGPTRDTALFVGGERTGRDPAGFERWAAALAASDAPEDVRRTPDLFRGLAAVEARDWARAVSLLAPLPALWPDAIRTRRALALALLYTGDAAGAMAQLDALARLDPDASSDRWDRVVAATMLGDHAAARAHAASLGMSFATDEGPIDEAWEECVLVVEDASAEDADDPRELRALRTGPVTARVVAIARPGAPCAYGDVWVFDARPLNAAPPDGASDEDRAAHRWKYPAVTRLHEGAFRTFELDGAAPDDEGRARLFGALTSLGCGFRGTAGNGYTLRHPDGGDARVDGLYLCVAAPASATDAELHARLTEVNATLALPLCWEALARAAGDDEAAAQHADRFDAYGVNA